MRNSLETGKARPPRSKVIPITVGAMGILGAYFIGEAGLAKIDESNQNKARAEAQQTITDCRDTVRCTLGKISLAYEKKFPGIRKVNSKLTDQTIALDGKTFKVGMSKKYGNVLIDEDGTQFLATHNLGNTVENVNAVLRAEGETK